MCCHTEFCRSASKGIGLTRETPRSGECWGLPLGMGHGWPLKPRQSFICVTTLNAVILRCDSIMSTRLSSGLKELEQFLSFLAYDILIFLASKHMHNFPPYLSCVATLPENILATIYAQCFLLGGWLYTKMMDDATSWQSTNSSVP